MNKKRYEVVLLKPDGSRFMVFADYATKKCAIDCANRYKERHYINLYHVFDTTKQKVVYEC